MAQYLNEPRLLGETTITLGGLLEWRGEFEQGCQHLQTGLQLSRQTHSGFFVGHSLFFLGHASLSQGEYENALSLHSYL
jgi:hypothetical protein